MAWMRWIQVRKQTGGSNQFVRKAWKKREVVRWTLSVGGDRVNLREGPVALDCY